MKPCQNQDGIFITFEGPDGAGKTTQAQMLKERLLGCGLEAVVTREPGGTAISEEIRKVLLNPQYAEMTVTCEVLLYSAARAQLVAEVIKPALETGRVIICDRFFDSSTVYQGYAGAENPEMIKMINMWATGGVIPDMTLLMNIEAEAGLERLGKKSENSPSFGDRMEQKALAFHRRVQEGFLKLARQEPGRFRLIDAAENVHVIHDTIWTFVWQMIQERSLITRAGGDSSGV